MVVSGGAAQKMVNKQCKRKDCLRPLLNTKVFHYLANTWQRLLYTPAYAMATQLGVAGGRQRHSSQRAAQEAVDVASRRGDRGFGLPQARAPARSLRGEVERVSARAGRASARKETATMMPVGVPRVPYRMRRENVWQWVDIWNCLYQERVIFVGRHIDDDMGNQLVGTMLYLDSESPNTMSLYINCPGGDIVPTMSLKDTIAHMRSDTSTVAFGGAFGLGGFLLASGTKGKRYSLPHTRIMLHHPSGAARGMASDMANEARELVRIRTHMNKTLSEKTGQTEERIHKDLQRNFYFSPEEASQYGVIDRVGALHMKKRACNNRCIVASKCFCIVYCRRSSSATERACVMIMFFFFVGGLSDS